MKATLKNAVMKAATGLLTGLVTALLAVVPVTVATMPAAAQQALGPKWFFAEAYAQWQLFGNGPNTFSWNNNSGTCYTNPLNDGPSPSFFVFGPSASAFPIYIRDDNPTLSEIVTPSSTSVNSATCSFAAATVNNHTSFWVQSGTAGLQEAITTNGTNTVGAPQVTIWLDKNFYSLVAALPGNKTVKGLIGAASGYSNIELVDLTTSPNTNYVWNGSAFVTAGAPAALFNQFVSTYTAMSAPTALSTSASTNGLITTAPTGGSIPASSTYRLAATYVDASGGETVISTDSASTATIATGSGTSTNTISVTSPAAATGAVGWRLYVTAANGASGTEILYSPTCSTTLTYPLQTVLAAATVCPIGATATVTAIVTGTATVPAIASAWARTAGTSTSWPPFSAGGAVNAAATGTVAIVNFPAGFMNTLGRKFRICGDANYTTNGTPGTLTLASTVASVPGVTSITAASLGASGTTTASADVPSHFCFTYETGVTGTSGKLWVHGNASYVLNPASNNTGTWTADSVVAISSAIDLTKQDQIAFTITPTTTALTAFQVTGLDIQLLN